MEDDDVDFDIDASPEIEIEIEEVRLSSSEAASRQLEIRRRIEDVMYAKRVKEELGFDLNE